MSNEETREKRTDEARDQDNADLLVSVSCITFNHGRYLRKALDSFLEQKTNFRYEILIHDDASTDDTIEIIREYAARYPEIIRPMYEEENQYSQGISNISGVFNFPRAQGRYIAMCEGDDYWCDPDKLQKQADYMEAHPECSLCTHAAGIAAEAEAFRSESEIRPYKGTRVLEPEEVISRRTNIPTASLFFRTEYARTLPRWYFDCPVGDVPLQLWMLLQGSVYYMDEIMSMYRMDRQGSWGEMMDRESPERIREKWEKHYTAMARLYDAFDKESGERWSGAVREALRRQRFHIDLKEGKDSAVLDPANRGFLRELPEAEARLLTLKARLPGVYRLLQTVYRRLKGR